MAFRSNAIVALLAIVIGLLFSPIPTHLGFYRWLATRNPATPENIGLTPAMNHGVEWGYTFDQLYTHDLTGQNALVTGANSGLGYQVSLVLAKLGASVVMACRNEARCLQAAQDIRKHNDVKGQVFPMTVELSSLKSVQSFANSYLDHIGNGSLDMLFMNAGIRPQTPMDANEYLLSEDGIELVFATNVVGHHLLYKRLERELAKSKMARVVLTSSCTSMINLFNYTMATDLDTLNNEAVTLQNGENLYGQSKLAQIMWAKKLTRRLGSKSHTFVNSVNPGLVATPIFSKGPLPAFLQTVIGWLQPKFWSADIAALSLLYLGVATEELEKKNIRGKYYHPVAVEVVNPFSFDEELQDKVWSFLDDLVKEFV